ncbi:hypothetical protein B0H63DRAFT_510103 [Podospora didyma]|uniref:Transglutaminase-like domain-containing protein n=1 Tax=Podospora didyma TaxID=330526 RepID=A0AAE0TZM6_9PEZI|nr:hypothetical protein B0H63DRAFT_510103 [Podospora didyma]
MAASCNVCRDYTAIDTAATTFSLDKLWTNPEFKPLLDDIKAAYNKLKADNDVRLRMDQTPEDKALQAATLKWNAVVMDWEAKTSKANLEKLGVDLDLIMRLQQQKHVREETRNLLSRDKKCMENARIDDDATTLARYTADYDTSLEWLANVEAEITSLVSKIDTSLTLKNGAAKGTPKLVDEWVKLKQADATFLAEEDRLSRDPNLLLHQQNAENIRILARRLYAKCGRPLDYPERARFFFTWVASSITFSPAADSPNDFAIRSPATTIATGKEVCRHYAGLFAAMFNAIPDKPAGIPPQETYTARTIEGYYKKDTHKAALNPMVMHAWNVYPTGIRDKNAKMTYKLIDVCWGSRVHADGTTLYANPLWFTLSNKSMLIRHYPLTFPDKTIDPDLKDAFLSAADRQAITPSWAGTLDDKQFWANDFPDIYMGVNATRFVEQASLVPSNWVVNRPSAGGNTRFEFQLSCPHQIVRAGDAFPAAFYLLIGDKQAGGRPVYRKAGAVFSQDAARPGTFVANVDLDKEGVRYDGTWFATLAVEREVIGNGNAVLKRPAAGAALDGTVLWDPIAEWRVGSPAAPTTTTTTTTTTSSSSSNNNNSTR